MSTTEEYTAPEITEEDYYSRLGVPSSAESDEIQDHADKYAAELRPEISTHQNAEQRWKRFNTARQTLADDDSKENYDIFRDRFGSKQAAEAYETWGANDALGDPDNVSPRELGLEAEVDESEPDERSRNQKDRSQRGRRQSRESTSDQNRQKSSGRQRQQTRRERRRGQSDIDTDSTKTYSTRTTESNESAGQTSDSDLDDDEKAESSRFQRVVRFVRTNADLASVEVSTLLSMLDITILSYVSYLIVIEILIGSVSNVAVRDGATVLFSLGVIGVFGWEYLQRFNLRVVSNASTQTGNPFTRSDSPIQFIMIPSILSVLLLIGLALGGARFTILLFAASILSLYGRFQQIKNITTLPSWTDYVSQTGGVLATIGFIAIFIQTGISETGTLAGAELHIIAGTILPLLLLSGLPVIGVGHHFMKYSS